MRRTTLLFVIVFSVLNCVATSSRGTSVGVPAHTVVRDSNIVELFLRNDKARFRNVTFAVYMPYATRGEVESRVLLPWQRTRFRLPIGAKIYVTDEEEVRMVIAGRLLTSRPPDLTVRADDEGQIYRINR